MAGNYIVNVPKLKGRENYDEWAFAAENFLILEGIDVHKTEGTVTAETQKAKAKLIMTIDPSLFVHIKSEQTVSGVWKKLKSLFDDSGFTRKINLLRNLISIRLESCDSMTSYVTQVVDTSSKLRRTGFEINDKWIGSLLLAGLPDKYSPMIMAIEHSGIAITADVIKTKLLDMSTDVGSNETDSAFLSRSWQRNKNSGKVGKNAGMSSQGPANVKTIKCYRCKQIGHYKNKCPLLHEKPTNAFNVVFLSGNFSKEEWYVDSGASAHMISSDKNMVNIKHNLKTKEIIVANQVSVPVLSSGDTQITTVVNNSEYDISVKNVLCIPALTTNLLSVSQLIENGNKVIFKRKVCYIRNQRDELIGIAELVNGVYRLVIKPEKLLVASAMNTTGMIWHRRLGHINSRDLNIMKNGAVKGISYNDKAEIGKLNCTVCCEGKQARLPFPHRNNRSKRVLEIVHADVCGPMETKSIGLSRYFLLFVDDYSRMSFVYFLKNKSEVFNCFRRFKCMVEKQKNTSIKILRTDNGTEFCSNEMSNFLQESGVIHQKTNPYTPQQNGLCERFNRSVVEKARCLLFDKNLDKIFWAEAVHTAVYLKNRSLASGLDQKTPYELWTEEKPDVSHIRIFGSTVMAHVPKEKRLKWDRKAEKHYLVGYADNVKGYRLYNPVTNKIITSRDVSIMETSGHMEMVQAVIDEKPASPPLDEMEQQTSDDTNTDLLQTNATYDNTYVADENTSSSSSDDPSDIISDTEINNISFENEITNEKRERRQPERFGFGNMCVETDVNMYGDQITLQEAMNGTESKEWRKAMKEELQAYEENEAWEVVDRPEHGTVVQCKWVFRKKFQSDNKVRYRARLVAKGFTQKPGIDYNETFSPVLRYSTLRLLFALSAKFNLEMTHLDVTTAFLNGYINETVYMNLPESFVCKASNKVLKLKRAIYGLKQSARAWYQRVNDCLLEIGYTKSMHEPCLFFKCNNNVKIFIALFVDDFFVFANCSEETVYLENELKSKFKIKNLGQIKQCLGMRVQKVDNVITVDQEQFVEHLLNKFNMTDCKHVSTPMEVNLKIEKSSNCNSQYPYQQLIGSLLYLSILTRPDISYSVCYLSQFNNSFNETHWKHAKRILRYLQSTKQFGIKFAKDDLDLIGFVDADWASDSIDRRSYTGYLFKMSGSVISYECKKQQTIALSSTEAEYMAICEASKEAIYLKFLLSEIKWRENLPMTLYNDNQSAQKLAENHSFHKRSKHIDVKYHFVRTAVENKIVKLKYLKTTDMPADMLTKSLSSQKHYKFLKQLGIVNIYE